jgi:hypothetical protein
MSNLNSPCLDCGTETLPVDERRAEWYMVRDELWRAAGMTDEPGSMQVFLCIGCLEARLGRRLVAADFSEVRLNDLANSDNPRYAWSWRTPRLISRLTPAKEARMKTPEKIRTVAADEGWTHTELYDGCDEFVRTVPTPDDIHRMQRAGEVSWQAQERIVVHYSDVGGITDGSFAGPGQQAALTGKFVGVQMQTKGPDRRGQVIKWLERSYAS